MENKSCNRERFLNSLDILLNLESSKTYTCMKYQDKLNS